MTGGRSQSHLRLPSKWAGAALFSIAGGAAIFAAIHHVRRSIDDSISRSTLSALGQALLLYENDNRGTLPDSWGRLMIAEDITPSVFVAPGSGDKEATGRTSAELARSLDEPGRTSYIYTAASSARSALTNASVLAYQQTSKPTDGTNVLFGDGHVQRVSGGSLARLLKELHGRSHAATQPVELSAE